MSRLTTDSQAVYTVILYGYNDYEEEIADYIFEDDAIVRAQEEVGKYIAKTGEYCYCKIERRVLPIYM